MKVKTNKVILPERFNSLRKDKKLTLEKIAELSGVSLSTVKRIATGNGHPDGTNLLLISKALECSAEYLIGESNRSMEEVYVLLKLFGERYVFCDDDQAGMDALPVNRDELVKDFSVILNIVRDKK